MVDVLVFDSHLLHRMRGQKGLDLGHNGTIETQKDDLIILMDDSVDKNAVNCGSVALDHLDFHDCAVKLLVVNPQPLLYLGNSHALFNQGRH